MLSRILERPTSVILAALTAVTLGGFSLLRLPVSLLPTLERPQLRIVVEDADRSRADFVQRVVEPLERRFLSLEGVISVRSFVDDGLARLEVESEWQTDTDRLRIDAERRLSEVGALALDNLTLATATGENAPILQIGVIGGDASFERANFAERVLMPELSRLPGAGEVRRTGGARLRVVVRPLGAALVARGLMPSEVRARLERVGATRSIGTVRDGGLLRPTVVRSTVSSLEELGELRLGEEASVPLRDVARVTLEETEDRGHYRLQGEDATLVEVFRAPGANAVQLAREVRAAVSELRTGTPSDIDLVLVRDASREVVAALRELGLAAVLGLALGTVVLRLMLGSWRPTLALIVVVPSSVLAAFGAFLIWGVSLDVVSLAGLALALGMLVDNSIVVLESIASVAAARQRGAFEGEGDAVVDGARRVAMALLASFLTTAVVFLPLLYLQGLARAFFGVQAFAIVSSLAISLALSLTLTPVLSRLLRHRRGEPPPRQRHPGRELYLRALDRALRAPRAFSLLVVVASMLIIWLCLQRLERELVPAGARSSYRVDFSLPADLDERAAREHTREVEEALTSAAIGTDATRSVGGAARLDVRFRPQRLADPFQPMDESEGQARVEIADLRADPGYEERLDRAVASVAGVVARGASEPPLFASALDRAGGAYQVEASASSMRRARQLAHRLATHLSGDHGMSASIAEQRRRRSAYYLRWSSLRAARLGTDDTALAGEVRAGLGGLFAGQIDTLELDQAEPEIVIEATVVPDLGLLPIAPPIQSSPASDSDLETAAAVGQRTALLHDVATLELDEREPIWSRLDGRPTVTVAVSPGALALSPARLERALSNVELSADESWRLSGAAYELDRSFAQLRLALGLALVLVFLTVATLYESFKLPLAVMATAPVAGAGALAALLIARQSLNVMSFLGVILLTGIVVNNSIVLLDRISQHHRPTGGRSLTASAAIVGAATGRYRPITMTTLTTLLGMAPLALFGGPGMELRRSLAVAVSGGLVAGLLASLMLVPTLYLALHPAGAAAGND